MAVFAGRGDPRRSLALLWRSVVAEPGRTQPGPKQALSVDAIVEAAIAVADTEGMAALSMRAVGERLGRTAMALYTYVPSKGELVDLMYDQVFAELDNDRRSAGWRAAVTGWAEDLCEVYVRHPWALQVSSARPVLGPHEYAVIEAVVRALAGTGLDGKLQRSVVATLSHFVRGAAQTIADARRASAATGVPDDEWWSARSTALQELVPDIAERFPALMRLETSAPIQPADERVPYLEQAARDTFATGLAVLLDGVDATLSR